MNYGDIVILLSESHATNDVGDAIPTTVRRKVFANKQSVRQSEFYQAQSTGLRPELMFVVRNADYSDEPKLEYKGKTYTIIRTYIKKGELVELLCQGLVNNHG